MSSSTERKLRQAAAAAGTDKKSAAAKEAAEKAKKEKRSWTIGTVVVAAIIIFALVVNYFPTQKLTAVKFGEEKSSVAELNYYYGNAFQNWYGSYGSYASYFGLDVSKGLSGLKAQQCNMLENGTWSDYFLQLAKSQMQEIKALVSYADANGITLSAEEKAKAEASLDALGTNVLAYGYKNLESYLKTNYGTGVTRAVALACSLDGELASKAYNAYMESLSYSEEELGEHYASFEGSKDYYSISYYLVSAENVTAVDADGNETSAPDATTKAAAQSEAKAILAAYEQSENKSAEDFAAAVAEVKEGAAANENRLSGASLASYAFNEWVKDSARAEGDTTMVPNSDESGWYVVRFGSHDDNNYNTVSVRHILVKAAADENGKYSDEAIAAAEAKANEIYAEWKSGAMTEESFAELAEKYSEDGGSNTNGGLYEQIYKNQMVEEFNDFCFAGHKTGDTAIVFNNGGYCGYHIVYFVGEGECYADLLAKSDLINTAMDEWIVSLAEPFAPVDAFGLRFAA